MAFKDPEQRRAYNKKYFKKHYRKNRAHYVARAHAWNVNQIAANKNRIREYLSRHPCVDCGEGDPVVLEFDHVRGTKTTHVANMSRAAWGWERIVEEISKCEVRCANCHRRVTHSRRVLLKK